MFFSFWRSLSFFGTGAVGACLFFSRCGVTGAGGFLAPVLQTVKCAACFSAMTESQVKMVSNFYLVYWEKQLQCGVMLASQVDSCCSLSPLHQKTIETANRKLAKSNLRLSERNWLARNWIQVSNSLGGVAQTARPHSFASQC